jgi:dihydrodipicolinate synthase/N-acetylneuraminate lyase
MTNPWNGVLTATATPFKSDLSVDYDKYAEHVAWLAANGTHGVIPNGSLGEYQVLTAEERAKMVEVAVAAAPKGFSVVPGVAAYGAAESRKWAEHAQNAGAGAVMLLPPNAYRASDDEVVAHYKEVAKVGIPIIAYNNPFDTKVDLTPKLVARIADEVPNVVAIKEFSGDVRADDVFLELSTAGISGWIAGFPNALPKESMELYNLATSGNFKEAAPMYAALHDVFHWDSKKEFIQAIKLGMDHVGRYGGPTRLPRLPLPKHEQEQIHREMDVALAYFKNR